MVMAGRGLARIGVLYITAGVSVSLDISVQLHSDDLTGQGLTTGKGFKDRPPGVRWGGRGGGHSWNQQSAAIQSELLLQGGDVGMWGHKQKGRGSEGRGASHITAAVKVCHNAEL